jgi:hypothetical protein
MSIETWDLLAKNQTDPENIEAAITRMISAHNDDPTAHMADDQSIGLHRINDVLDHPVGSVVTDKVDYRELSFFCNSADFSNWSKGGQDFWEYEWPIYHNYLDTVAGYYTEICNVDEYFQQFYLRNKTFNFRWVMSIIGVSYVGGKIGIGSRRGISAPYQNFLGFVFTAGLVSAKYDMPYSSSRETFESASVAVSDVDFHYYFVNYNVTENVFRWYIDGTLIAEYTPVHGASQYLGTSLLDLQTSGGDYVDIYLKSFEYNLTP